MKPSTKTVAYLKRMISMDKWQDRLPPVRKIADKLEVSDSTVRKSIRILEEQRSVENNGSLGYTIIPKKFEDLYKSNKQLYYLAMLQRSIRIANLLQDGGQIIDNHVFVRRSREIIAGDIASGDILKTSVMEIVETLQNPITTESMLTLDGEALIKTKTRYHRQQRINKIAEIVMSHRRELGL